MLEKKEKFIEGIRLFALVTTLSIAQSCDSNLRISLDIESNSRTGIPVNEEVPGSSNDENGVNQTKNGSGNEMINADSEDKTPSSEQEQDRSF